MLGIKYLNQAHLRGFDVYKYNCVDTSILSVYIMHPFWNKCVQYFPRWMAPNLITFVGFMLTVLNFFIIAFFDWDFTAANTVLIAPSRIPNWLWMIVAINIFLAYTLDGIDGKQARRTGTSSPLGELFDHGLDSYSAVLINVYMFSLLGTDDLSPIRMYFLCCNTFLNFYLPHVEKYITGVMFLPWGYDFMMWGFTLVLAATSLLGPAIWRTPVFGIQPSFYLEILLYGSATFTSHPVISWNIYKSYRDKTGKMRSFVEAVRPMTPLVILFTITTFWVFFSVNNIVLLQPRMVFVLCGTLFSNICCRLIVAQMSNTRADLWNFLLGPIAVVAILTTTPIYDLFSLKHISIQTEIISVYVLTAVVTIAHLHYGQGVVREMCQHFKIKCFKVSPVKINASNVKGSNSDCSAASNGIHDFNRNNEANHFRIKNRD